MAFLENMKESTGWHKDESLSFTSRKTTQGRGSGVFSKGTCGTSISRECLAEREGKHSLTGFSKPQLWRIQTVPEDVESVEGGAIPAQSNSRS